MIIAIFPNLETFSHDFATLHRARSLAKAPIVRVNPDRLA